MGGDGEGGGERGSDCVVKNLRDYCVESSQAILCSIELARALGAPEATEAIPETLGKAAASDSMSGNSSAEHTFGKNPAEKPVSQQRYF